jgi:hypothetical protein
VDTYGLGGFLLHFLLRRWWGTSWCLRRATDADEGALRRLAELNSRRPLSGPALIGRVLRSARLPWQTSAWSSAAQDVTVGSMPSCKGIETDSQFGRVL